MDIKKIRDGFNVDYRDLIEKAKKNSGKHTIGPIEYEIVGNCQKCGDPIFMVWPAPLTKAKKIILLIKSIVNPELRTLLADREDLKKRIIEIHNLMEKNNEFPKDASEETKLIKSYCKMFAIETIGCTSCDFNRALRLGTFKIIE
ncbi:MAG: hypothetical protein EBZ49_00650 [Proteobacteria bacterium]|nr:hypothetical protein [Pseudomonadota bacterium]